LPVLPSGIKNNTKVMDTKQVAAAALTGTSLMTLFSEVISKLKGSNYNEAQILGELLNRITPLNKTQAQAAGWVGHYTVGVGFAAVYAAYLKATRRKPTLLNGLVYGALSGLAGAGIWHATFKAHPNPPGVDLKNYYKQLVLAHVVFGAVASLTLQKSSKHQPL
jgi:hypothetical protein